MPVRFPLSSSHAKQGPLTLNIWLNRTYATNYWFLQMLRSNPDGVDVRLFATHTDPTSPVLQAADVSGAEPSVSGDAYVDWVLEYCVANRIDVLLPGRGVLGIAQRVEEFEAVGVRVLVSPAASIALLDDKDATYSSASGLGLPVPPWCTARGAQEMAEAYASLRAELEPDEAVCIKPVVGVGGEGFRVIDDRAFSLDDLLAAPAHRVRLDDVLSAMTAAEDAGREVPRFMVLPYMASPEISVDCLSTAFGETLAALPRAKAGRQRTFEAHRPEAVEIARRVVDSYQLAYLSNTQLRWWRGELALLEVNTRPSGGLYASQLTGVNLPWAAVQLATSGSTGVGSVDVPQLGGRFVTVETMVPLPHAVPVEDQGRSLPATVNVNPGLAKTGAVEDLEVSVRRLAGFGS